jgi:hypothetical protein
MPERVPEVAEEGRLGSSDHVLITAKIVIKSSPPQNGRDLPD